MTKTVCDNCGGPCGKGAVLRTQTEVNGIEYDIDLVITRVARSWSPGKPRNGTYDNHDLCPVCVWQVIDSCGKE
jgi:hypothetical protein